MARSAIPVDLTNPGQVFACLGFMEATEVLLGRARAVFDWTDGSRVMFVVEAPHGSPPVEAVLKFVSEASVSSVAPRGAGEALSTKQWGVPTVTADDDVYPGPAPNTPTTLPARLELDGRCIQVDYWADGTRRDKAKFWAGNTSGAGLLANAVDLIRESAAEAVDAPFSLGRPQSSAFGLDWRRDYVPIDVGFAPNKHKSTLTMFGYPLVEVLGALGLSHARPQRVDKFEYRYSVIGAASPPLQTAPTNLHRLALGATPLPFAQRTFRAQLGRASEESKSRCILEVTEENE